VCKSPISCLPSLSNLLGLPLRPWLRPRISLFICFVSATRAMGAHKFSPKARFLAGLESELHSASLDFLLVLVFAWAELVLLFEVASCPLSVSALQVDLLLMGSPFCSPLARFTHLALFFVGSVVLLLVLCSQICACVRGGFLSQFHHRPLDLSFPCLAPALNSPPAVGLICTRFLFAWCSLLLCGCGNLSLRVLL
jgi:hypothetical protein